MAGIARVLNNFADKIKAYERDKPPQVALEAISRIQEFAQKLILIHQYRIKHGQSSPLNLQEEGLSAVPILPDISASFDRLQREIRAAREALQGRFGGAAAAPARPEKRFEPFARAQGIPLLDGEPIGVSQKWGHQVSLENYEKVLQGATIWGSRFDDKIGDGGDGVILSTTWQGRPAAVKACINPDDFEKEVMMHLIAPPGTVPRVFAIGPNYFVMERFENSANFLYGQGYKYDRWINHQIISHYLALAERGIYWVDVTKRNLLFRHGDRGEIQIAFCDLAGCAYIKDGVVDYFPSHESFRNCGRTVEAVRQFSREKLLEHIRTQWCQDFVPVEKRPLPRPHDERDAMRISPWAFPRDWYEPGGILEQLGFKKVTEMFCTDWRHDTSPTALIEQMGELLGPDYNLKIGDARQAEGGGRYANWSAEHRAAKEGPLRGRTAIP